MVSNYSDLWYAFNINAKNNQESIFELQFSAEAKQANWCHQMFGFANSFTIPGYGYMFYLVLDLLFMRGRAMIKKMHAETPL